MKQINKILTHTLILAVLVMSYSCQPYLDKSPLSDIEESDPFKNFTNFQGFTEELYNCVPLVSAHDYHNCFNWGEEIIWESGITYPMATQFDQGNFWAWESASGTSWLKQGGTPSSTDRFSKGSLWGFAWYAIRKANVGLNNLDLLTDATDEERDLIAGQLYFFRGWFHFMVMQYWGGLPYVDYMLPSDEVIAIDRLNYQDTAEKAAADFAKAAELLPVDWDDTDAGKTTLGNNNQRINKVMALAYLGKNLLWAASPLMNNESKGVSEYDTDLAKRAATAFADALDIVESTGRYELASFEDYTSIFYLRNSGSTLPGLKEAIFMENVAGLDGRWRWNMVNDFRPPIINASGVKQYPTSNYVNYYGMQNGYPINDSNDVTSSDATTGFDAEHPWKDRDPRFYKDIMYDGVKCQLNTKGNLTEYYQYASLYTDGAFRDITLNTTKGARTGYMTTKLCPQLMNDTDGYASNNSLALSFMRLSDVYLMYAEATAVAYQGAEASAELSSGQTFALSAVGAIDKVRTRAGVEGVQSKYLSSIDLFLSEVYRERAVELAFEGHRFTDLRRWMLLTSRPYTYKKAVYFDRENSADGTFDYDNPQDAKVLNIREEVILERSYTNKHYWLPFAIEDVSLYEGFSQNPGW